MKTVSDYYQSNKPAESVLNFLGTKYGERDSYSVEELGFIDSFHMRGRAATSSLAEASQIQKNAVILDIGSGPGGTARYLSSSYGATVVGIDLTYDFSFLASTLSKKTSLAEKNSFLCGNAIELPFRGNSFDFVWMEHVQMNIENKLLLLTELYRVLKPGGSLSFYEVFQTGNKPPDYPLPWSDASESGSLISPEMMQVLSEEAGFVISHWYNCYDEIVRWHVKNSGKGLGFNKGMPGVYLLMGAWPQHKVENFTTAVRDKRLAVVEAVLKK